MRSYTNSYTNYASFIDATFAKGNQISTLTFNVVDDTIPELDETFVIRLTAATLLHQRIDTRVDHPPSLKTNAISVNVTVKENDHPYGLIGFDREKVIYHEWQNKVKLPVVRNGEFFTSYFFIIRKIRV